MYCSNSLCHEVFDLASSFPKASDLHTGKHCTNCKIVFLIYCWQVINSLSIQKIAVMYRMFSTMLPPNNKAPIIGEFRCFPARRYKASHTEELLEMQGDQDLKEACRNLEEGFRLTLWAYDSEESEVGFFGD